MNHGRGLRGTNPENDPLVNNQLHIGHLAIVKRSQYWTRVIRSAHSNTMRFLGVNIWILPPQTSLFRCRLKPSPSSICEFAIWTDMGLLRGAINRSPKYWRDCEHGILYSSSSLLPSSSICSRFYTQAICWTSRGHRYRPFCPPVHFISIARRVQHTLFSSFRRCLAHTRAFCYFFFQHEGLPAIKGPGRS